MHVALSVVIHLSIIAEFLPLKTFGYFKAHHSGLCLIPYCSLSEMQQMCIVST